MPESFIKDQSVPARWRLLGIVNGFLLNGKPFYGSNEWLMEKLDCSEQTVSNAVAELERLGEINCERTRRSRVITRKLRDPNQLGSKTQVGSSRDPNQLGTNSVSNSVSKYPAQGADYVIVEEEEKPRKATKLANAEYEDGLKWAEKRRGFPFVSRLKQYSALKKAKVNGIGIEKLVERWKELEAEPFYQEHGLDWMMVLSSFDKRV